VKIEARSEKSEGRRQNSYVDQRGDSGLLTPDS
jgi:hypothetical protein